MRGHRVDRVVIDEPLALASAIDAFAREQVRNRLGAEWWLDQLAGGPGRPVSAGQGLSRSVDTGPS